MIVFQMLSIFAGLWFLAFCVVAWFPGKRVLNTRDFSEWQRFRYRFLFGHWPPY